jgi:hypothetical protein
VTWGFTPALKHSLNSLKAMDQKPHELKTGMIFELEHRLSLELHVVRPT